MICLLYIEQAASIFWIAATVFRSPTGVLEFNVGEHAE